MKRKTKKSAKRRAHTTHGYGSMKKNRGAGNKGGVGNAGSGKKADQKKPSIHPGKYFGKRGFHSVHSEKIAISVYELSKNVSKFEKKGALTKEGDLYNLDLGKAGVQKLIATGNVNGKFNIRVDAASPKAVEKVEKAGGKVELLKSKETSSEPPQAAAPAEPAEANA
jgi:large subunit ribosomal protein L15